MAPRRAPRTGARPTSRTERVPVLSVLPRQRLQLGREARWPGRLVYQGEVRV